MADDPAITPHSAYTALADDQQPRRAAYESFCSSDEHGAFLTAIREATYTGYPLVGQDLKSRLQAQGYRVERGKPGRKAAAKEAAEPCTAQLLL